MASDQPALPISSRAQGPSAAQAALPALLHRRQEAKPPVVPTPADLKVAGTGWHGLWLPHVKRWTLGGFGTWPWRWGDREVMFTVLAFAALLYTALYHPYWARGGDSELYLSIGRHLVRGQGFIFNGQPVGLVPPVWPLVIGLGMWLTSLVGVLKLMMPLCILIYLGCAYRVMRRIAGPWTCALAVGLVAMTQTTFMLTLWFHSDPIFLAFSWVGVLLAVQAGERYRQSEKGYHWRAAAAIGMACLALGTRWTGILWAPMIAAGFLMCRHFVHLGPDRRSLVLPLWPRRWDAMISWSIACFVLIFLTFVALRVWVKVDPAQIDPRYDTFETGRYALAGTSNRLDPITAFERLVNGPQWLSVLYWNQMARTGFTHYFSWWLAAVTAVPLAVAGLVGLARRQWLWVGVAGAWVPVMAIWPHAIDRYVLPVAPFLVLGTILGTRWLMHWLQARLPDRRQWLRFAPVVLMLPALAMFLAYNVGVYSLERWTTQDFFSRYERGIQPSLNRIGYFLRQNLPVLGGEVAISRLYPRPATPEWRLQLSRGLKRNLNFVMDEPAIEYPATPRFDPQDPAFLAWAAERNVQWLVLMPHQEAFMVHCKTTPWDSPSERQRKLTLDMDWQLWRVTPWGAVQVDLRDDGPHNLIDQVLVVPGLEDLHVLGRRRPKLPIRYN